MAKKVEGLLPIDPIGAFQKVKEDYLRYFTTMYKFRENRYDYLNAPMRTATGTADDWTCALYAQDEFDWVKWFNLTTGLRIIENGGFGFHVTPKVSTMFSLGDFRLRLGWSQGFKSPTTKELSLSIAI